MPSFEEMLVGAVNNCKGDEQGILIIQRSDGRVEIHGTTRDLSALCFLRVVFSTHVDHLVFNHFDGGSDEESRH